MQALNCHSLCVIENQPSWHIQRMKDQDKNGGPNYLRDWRAYRKLTQQELADAVGTNANMIQYLESGERGLSAKWLRRLAPVLDTTPGMILDHNPNELDSDVVDIWATASARQKRQLSDVARALVKTGTDDK
jgi:transcriptional regulator with XRE-family HTH domain